MSSDDETRRSVRRMPNRRMLEELAMRFGAGKLQVEALSDDPPKEDGGAAGDSSEPTTKR